jgi:flagellar biosynthesis/type III secretory pathway chaperone
MAALSQIVANLEQQCALYTDLESVLAEQQSALIGRATDRLEAANRRHALLAEALATAETQRQEWLNALPAASRSLRGLLALANDASLKERLERLAALLPARLQRVTHLVRTNRLLAADAAQSCAHLLRLLGIEDATGYAPPTQARPAPAHSLSLDVTA